MKLTTQQLAAVEAEDHTYVQACPGSGKTRVLIAKALRELRKVADSPRKIACITFTNAAVDEMEQRLRALASDGEASLVDIGTIHSFCLTNIFKPFRCRLPHYANGFEIVAGDDARAHELFRSVAGRRGFRVTLPQLDLIGQIGIDSNGQPVAGDQEQWMLDCMPEYWDEYRTRGWIDFSLLLYESLNILRNYPEVKASLSAKYASALIDEFQDTTSLQLEVLKLLHSSRSTTFFLVGDPHQSIYRFAGASLEASREFVTAIRANEDFPLTGNFRSAWPIVRAADRLMPRTPQMEAIGKWADADADVSEYSTANVAEAVVQTFISAVRQMRLDLGSCAVLAARWTDLLVIARTCVRNGVAVVGPGARPYKRGRLIVPLLENLAAVASSEGSLRSTQRALERCANELPGFDRALLEGWNGRVIALELHNAALEEIAADASPLVWIGNMGNRVDQILLTRGIGSSSAFRMSAQEVIADIYANSQQGRVVLGAMTIENLGLFADPTKALKLMTVHASKGREFDAVAIVHMNEGRFPHFKSKTEEQVADGRRVAYVGVTRAKRLLHLIVDTSDRRNGPSRFIHEMSL